MDDGYNDGRSGPKKLVRGHGTKGKQHETKLETLENLNVLTNVR
jgi:hypothetical protein